MIYSIEQLEAFSNSTKYRNRETSVIESHIELWLRYKQLVGELKHTVQKAEGKVTAKDINTPNKKMVLSTQN